MEDIITRLKNRTDDKKTWPDGPWQTEPDKVEWLDPSTGLHCLIKRNISVTGGLCGYVGVMKPHPAFGCNYHSEWSDNEAVRWWRQHVSQRTEYKLDDIVVHGGLTFAGAWDDVNIWYFGFDCSHSGDFSPRMDAIEELELKHGWPNAYRDVAYVTAEVENLAKQLAAIK